MILLVHLLFGAAIGAIIKKIPLAVILAFFGHYLLDFLPHAEYSIENIIKKQWQKAAPDVLRVILDFSLGIILIFIFSSNQPVIYFCALSAIIPDVLSFLKLNSKYKFWEKHADFHQVKIHYFKNKKILFFWRILTQIAIAIISLVFLRI